jgi:hypothetical protein
LEDFIQDVEMTVKVAAFPMEDVINIWVGFVGSHAHEDPYHSGLKNVCGGSDSHWKNTTLKESELGDNG